MKGVYIFMKSLNQKYTENSSVLLFLIKIK